MGSGFVLSTAEIHLMNAGKSLLFSLPESSHELVPLLQELEKRPKRVHKMPSESMKYAMQPLIKALIAKQLLKHPDMDVNISVACCISEVLRIMVYKTPYTDEQFQDFFEVVVLTLEKLSSASGGGYNRMIKALKTLDKGKLSLMMCDLQLDRLTVRLFKQFLAVADSNSPGIVIKMKQIMVMIIEKTELLNHELVDLLVTSVRKENEIASPVCWQLGREVFKKCATQLKPHLPKKVAEEVYGPLMETIPSTTDTSKLREEASRKRKLVCLDVSTNMVRPVRRCQDIKKHEKKTISINDLPMPTKSVTEAQSVEHGENLVGKRIKVWWPADKSKYYQGVVKSFHCRKKRHKVLYDDGEKELLDLKQEQWELAEMASRSSAFEIKLLNAGKGLLILPESSAELLNVLEKMGKLLQRVKLHKGKETLAESMKNAMRPIIEALVAKELLRHHDMNVNISVAHCIYDVLKIMDDKVPYNDEQIKDLFDVNITGLTRCSIQASHFLAPLILTYFLQLGQAPLPRDMISVQGYSVKQNIAPTLEAIFKKYVICEVVKRIESSDVSTIVSDMDEIESKVSQAAAANINVSWLQDQLKSIHTRNKALKKIALVKEMKVNTTLVKRAARADVIERCEELVAAQERCVKAEECIKVLDERADLVEDKPISTSISKRAARAEGMMQGACGCSRRV